MFVRQSLSDNDHPTVPQCTCVAKTHAKQNLRKLGNHACGTDTATAAEVFSIVGNCPIAEPVNGVNGSNKPHDAGDDRAVAICSAIALPLSAAACILEPLSQSPQIPILLL